MFSRSLLIPIALFQVLPCRGEDFLGANSGSFQTFNDDFGADDSLSFLLPLLAGSGMEECFEGFDLNGLVEDPFATVADYCKPAETAKFNHALDAFQSCSHFDLKKVIETIASALLGLTLNCGSYSIQVGNLVDSNPMLMTGDIASLLSLPRVPDECVDAMVGDNPFGNMIMGANEFPDQEFACFADLAESLPSCTLKEWPVPIVGNWLKSVSCMVGNAETMVKPITDNLILNELEGLSTCLPNKISKENCQEVLDACGNTDIDVPFVSMYLPAPFAGPPLPSTFQKVLKSSPEPARLENTMERYEQYRQHCIAAEDRAIMERVPGITSQYLGVQSPLQGGSTFIHGFLTGAILVGVGFFVFSKVKGKSNRGGSKPYNTFELNDLELSTENRFT